MTDSGPPSDPDRMDVAAVLRREIRLRDLWIEELKKDVERLRSDVRQRDEWIEQMRAEEAVVDEYRERWPWMAVTTQSRATLLSPVVRFLMRHVLRSGSRRKGEEKHVR